jgi:hypothetical protein
MRQLTAHVHPAALQKGAAATIGALLNAGLRSTVYAEAAPLRPLTLFLSPDAIAFHEHTNLELASSILFSERVDILGFSLLLPVRHVPPAAAHGGVGEFLYHMECWETVLQRWILARRRPLFGYRRHTGYAALCDQVSNSFLTRTALAQGIAFNASMGDLAFTDFFLQVRRRNAEAARLGARAGLVRTRSPGYVAVGVCAECLLKAHVALPPLATDEGAAPSDATRGAFTPWGTYILPPPVREASLLPAFAEQHQVELLMPPLRVDANFAAKVASLPLSWLVSPLAELGDRGMYCRSRADTYDHSKAGLYSPLCHRFQRQRDFVLLARLWLNATLFQPPGVERHRRYGVSLHHGNLFGALRTGSELLWDTDGDIDFIGFDDSHDEMMQRWDKFLSYLSESAEIQRNESELQISVRGPKSPQTRGRPAQIHNVSVYYQGFRVYVNGFRNPWQSIRSDPGHDYRRRYLTMQGWVPEFTRKSVQCYALNGTHNACLPPCNTPEWLADSNFCSPVGDADALLSDELWLRDPLLEVSSLFKA